MFTFTDVFSLIHKEQERQEGALSLIASENYASYPILQATGSVLTNKYAEGYPSKRYYGGCQVIDEVENLAISLGKQLFNADHVNVQPHSGASANFAVYVGMLKPGDMVLGMSLAAGGHLTHGYGINFSGKFYNFIPYGVNPDTQLLDYDQIERLAHEHKPKMIVAGASAYSRLMDYQRLAAIAASVGATLMVDMAHIAGLVAANVIPSPIPWADVVSSTTHKTLRGPRGGMICSKAPFGSIIDKAIMPGTQGGPLMHVIAAKAIAYQEALQPSFKTYAHNVVSNAALMAQTFKDLGYKIVADGTDTHLFLIDLRGNKQAPGITGKEVEELLSRCNIIVNRNAIPFDTQSPMLTSGIRIGTPAVTTRGFGPEQVQQVAVWIDEAIKKRHDEQFLCSIGAEVAKLCQQFPIYAAMPPHNHFTQRHKELS